MRNRIYTLVMCALFAALGAYCPLLWLFGEMGLVALPETANAKLPEREYAEDVPLSALLNGIERGKAKIEDIYTNHMPLYIDMVGLVKDAERTAQALFLAAISPPPPEMRAESADLANPAPEGDGVTEAFDPSIYRSAKIGEDANNHRYYVFAPGDFIEGAITLGQEELKERAYTQASAINRIASAASKSGANCYLYNVSRMQDNDYFAQLVKSSYSTRPLLDYFNSLLGPEISVGWLDISSVELALLKIYRTDHHWSPEGTYSGYTDILGMMREKFPGIGEPYPMRGSIAIPGVEWRGYYSALSLYPAIYEDFTVMDIELPPHIMLDKKGNPFEYRYEEYMEGRYPTDTYFGHFNHYHGQPHKIICTENYNGRNLLMISDSMTYSVAALLAAHFEDTFILYPWDAPPVDFEQYIEANRITDVLFLMFSDRLMFDMYGDCDFSRYKTKN